LTLYYLGESEKENMNSDFKTLITPKMTTDRLFSKKVPSLKLLTAFFVLISGEKATIYGVF